MSYFYTVLATTATIIGFEIGFDYSLGDVVKDKTLEYVVNPVRNFLGRLFGGKKA